ncbi:hypothetical protein HY641_00555 [Candidatus Woesearchaeota archaeon]|nr:hypothetical protein [Candidatus Woesearchaeota archaeon]
MRGQLSFYLIIAVIVLLVTMLGSYLSFTKMRPPTISQTEIVIPPESPPGGPPSPPVIPLPQEKQKPIVSNLKYVPGVNRLQVFLVPINYEVNDPEFLDRVADYIGFAMEESNLTLGQFYIIPEAFDHGRSACPDANLILSFADDWHQRTYGLALPAREMHGKVPSHRHRVVGIDSWQGALASCGCGYTNDIYGPASYIGGGKCSRKPEALSHELGHSFGLCDEYDTCTWEQTSAALQRLRNVPCMNVRPDENNSICGNNCCSNVTACCIGKYADTKEDNAYNVMGAVGSTVTYHISNESGILMARYMCRWLQICGVTR